MAAKKIRIEIPEPCREKWDEMSPDAGGRFCGHCNKSVIDFSGWSDGQLLNFFARQTGPFCGRFRDGQLNRVISQPPQPHSRLYRIAVAMGLTLLFTQAGGTASYGRPPVVNMSFINTHDQHTDTATADTTGIRGVVMNSKKEPLVSASVILSRDSVYVAGGAD